MRDLVTGAPVVSGGEFRRGKLKIRKKSDGTWVIQDAQRLTIRNVSGLVTDLTRGTLKAKR